MGVSVVEVKNGQRLGGSASVFLRPAYYRQYADAAYRPGAASGFNENRRRPAGERVLGTMQNCANGHTPWGTYLTCEENWSDILSKADLNPLENATASATAMNRTAGTRWMSGSALIKPLTNPTVSAGWWRSIPTTRPPPRASTALGRFKHEGPPSRSPPIIAWWSTWATTRSLSTSISLSRIKYDPANREANMQLLTSGTLYVAVQRGRQRRLAAADLRAKWHG